jgi:hypothetical protein
VLLATNPAFKPAAIALTKKQFADRGGIAFRITFRRPKGEQF